MVIKDFEAVREENIRLKLQAQNAQNARIKLQDQFDELMDKDEVELQRL